VYDLFSGGGAMSFEFLQRPQIEKVYYNELNTGVVELLKKIKKEGVTKDFYRWFSREDFHRLKNNNDWIGGLVSTCWSFGNNRQKGYLFSKQNELLKRPLHELVVNKDIKMIDEFYNLTGLLIPSECIAAHTIKERRLAVMHYIKRQRRIDLEQLQHLPQLGRLEQLERLEITNLDYREVNITTPIDDTIIYLDPPYAACAKYQHDINHDDMYDWTKACPYTVYVSSYDSPYEVVYTVSRKSTLSATNNAKMTMENLYCNKAKK
jgi:site-specific DNA-adenine methylase